MEYENTLVTLEGCGIMPSSFPFSTSFRVVGSDAAVDLRWYWGGDMPVIKMEYYPQEGQPELLSIADFDPYEAECRYFIDCLQGKADPKLLSIETACDSLGIALAAKGSLEKQGKRVILENWHGLTRVRADLTSFGGSAARKARVGYIFIISQSQRREAAQLSVRQKLKVLSARR